MTVLEKRVDNVMSVMWDISDAVFCVCDVIDVRDKNLEMWFSTISDEHLEPYLN